MNNGEPGIPPALLRTTPAAVCHYIAAAGWPGQIIHIGHTTPPELRPVQAMAALSQVRSGIEAPGRRDPLIEEHTAIVRERMNAAQARMHAANRHLPPGIGF
jgi:hypothetical protein